MTQRAPWATLFLVAASLALAGCSSGGGGVFGNSRSNSDAPVRNVGSDSLDTLGTDPSEPGFFSLFGQDENPNVNVGVSKYLWTATLDVLGFLPIRSADPFTGTIITGYGTPPGGGRAYRAVVYMPDPALDARSLHLSLYTKGGTASPATVRAVEDAILTRARQLRSAESRL